MLEESCHKALNEKYGKIMKITGMPGRKNMVMLFDPDEIEKVSVQGNNMGSIMLHSVQFIMRPSPVHCYSKLPVQRSRRSR
jgi:hypothetical protein